jgi:tetratricopeptide (TPR) repeat protein
MDNDFDTTIVQLAKTFLYNRMRSDEFINALETFNVPPHLKGSLFLEAGSVLFKHGTSRDYNETVLPDAYFLFGFASYHRALEHYIKNHDKVREGHCYFNIGVSHRLVGATAQAIEYLNKALDVAKENGGHKEELKIYSFLGDYYDELKEFGKAIEVRQKALDIIQANKGGNEDG